MFSPSMRDRSRSDIDKFARVARPILHNYMLRQWLDDTALGWAREGIGAGLKSDEASDQRARGIAAEQAAALRARRDDPG